jgi:hypothetical protein
MKPCKHSFHTLGLVATAVLTAAGCNGSSTSDGARGDASIDGQSPIDVVGPDVQTPDGEAGDGGVMLPASFFPAQAPAFAATADDPLSVQVSVSGEALAEQGYDYTASPSEGAPVFVDGWEVHFDRYLVVLDHVKLNQPGADPSMRGVVGGLVAQQDGPWIVDVHKHGALTGAGGAPETAVPLFVFRMPTAGGAFNPTVRYAFSFDTVPASTAMHNVNLTTDASDIVAQMIAHRWTKYFSGTATYRGRIATATVDPTFQRYPTTVRFAFGFSDPASYVNCHNPELGAEDTPANRGIQPSATGHIRAQITMHTDHFFWDEADVEGTPLHFDPVAARAQGFGGDAGAMLSVTLDQLVSDLPAALTDALGMPVQNRGSQTMGVTDQAPPPAYNVHGAGGTIHDFRDFVTYNARGQGHLNSDGLCFVQPNGPLAY